jgi:hypothetical protein
MKKVIAGIVALVALALGGAALANAGGGNDHSTAPTSASQPGTENENDQPGDKGDTAEAEGSAENENDQAGDQGENEQAGDQGENENDKAGDRGDAGEQEGQD